MATTTKRLAHLFSKGSILRRPGTQKTYSLTLSFIAYSASVWFLGENFALNHASIVLFFNAMKVGCGFEAINLNKKVFEGFKKQIFLRFGFAFAWTIIISSIFADTIHLMSTLGAPLAYYWVKSFDGHLAGHYGSTLKYAYFPLLTVAAAIIVTFFPFAKSIELSIIFPVIFVCFFLIYMRERAFFITAEVIHATSSPLLLNHAISENLFFKNNLNIIFYKIGEATAQVLLFVNTRAQSSKRRSAGINSFVPFSILGVAVAYLTTYISLPPGLVLGLWICLYYLAAYFLLKYSVLLALAFIATAGSGIFLCTTLTLELNATLIILYGHLIFGLLILLAMQRK